MRLMRAPTAIKGKGFRVCGLGLPRLVCLILVHVTKFGHVVAQISAPKKPA